MGGVISYPHSFSPKVVGIPKPLLGGDMLLEPGNIRMNMKATQHCFNKLFIYTCWRDTTFSFKLWHDS